METQLLVWPATVLVLVVFICVFFQRNIRGFIDRAKSLKLPGGFHAEGIEPTQQQSASPALKVEQQLATEELGRPLREPVLDQVEDDARKRIVESVPDSKHHLDWALRLYAVAAVQRDHETTYRLIVGSQIKALKLLSLNGGQLPKDHLYALYVAAKTQYLDAFEQFGFDAWLGYMRQRGLVIAGAEDAINLTPRGYSFLAFMPLAGMSDEKMF